MFHHEGCYCFLSSVRALPHIGDDGGGDGDDSGDGGDDDIIMWLA